MVLKYFFKHDDVKHLEERFASAFLLGFVFALIFTITWFANGRPKPEDFDILSLIAATLSFGLFSFATMSTTVLPRIVQKQSKSQPNNINIPYVQNRFVDNFYRIFIIAVNSFILILILVKYASYLSESLHSSLLELGFFKGASAIIIAGIIFEIFVDVGCFLVLKCGIKSNPMMFWIIMVEITLTALLVVAAVMGIDFTSIFFQPTLLLGMALSVGHIFAHAVNR